MRLRLPIGRRKAEEERTTEEGASEIDDSRALRREIENFADRVKDYVENQNQRTEDA